MDFWFQIQEKDLDKKGKQWLVPALIWEIKSMYWNVEGFFSSVCGISTIV